MVGDEKEQETRRAAGVDGRCQPLALRHLILARKKGGRGVEPRKDLH
jgi:hypothetical protein